MKALTALTADELTVILQELVCGLKDIYGQKLKKVILFGSYARGDYDQESDIDIMILVDGFDREMSSYARSVSESILDIDLKYEVLIAEIVQDYGKFTRYLPVLPFYQSVAREGIIIYEQ